jgi:CubicO group peptidase (beta-lactamase class C family)
MRTIAAPMLLCALAGSAIAQNCTYDLSFVTPIVEQFLLNQPQVPGAVLVIEKNGVPIYQRAFGAYTINQFVPIASATKWPTSVLAAMLADRGLVGLDDPVGMYIPEFNTPEYAGITVRRCLSHTAGLPNGSDAISTSSITLAEAAVQIAAEGLRTGPGGIDVPPGSDFCYGGVSMQVSGRVAEIVGGAPYNDLIRDELFTPLGMTQSGFGDLQGENPRIAGGMSSTVPEYLRLLTMLLNSGVFRGERLLSAAMVDEILADQTFGVPITCSPAQVFNPGSRYGLGNWRLRMGPGDSQLISSSPGAFGCTPWIDRQRDVVGVFMILVNEGYQLTGNLVNSLQGQVNAAIDAVTPLPGDANFDGAVGLGDLALIINQWGWEAGRGDAGDLDRDGLVGLSDIAAVINRWGASCPGG